jgi:ubiquinone/menaquinone biosynthesis C-methylase UbiE
MATPMPWNLVASGYTSDILPVFERFASDALRFAEVKPGERILDVAAGPGTLSLAAERSTVVSAIDFAPGMVEQLRKRAKAADRTIDARVGDGMQLPWPDSSFDAAFSMFGLMFFEDRARGFSELWRILKPGGRAVVSSWTRIERTPLLAAFFEALEAELPHLPFGGSREPLADEEGYRTEISQAGFTDVVVREVSHGVDIPSAQEFLQSAERSNAPFALLKEKIGPEAFRPLRQSLQKRLEQELGTGPLRLEMTALLGRGRRPG